MVQLQEITVIFLGERANLGIIIIKRRKTLKMIRVRLLMVNLRESQKSQVTPNMTVMVKAIGVKNPGP
jgi:hypothetical protein